METPKQTEHKENPETTREGAVGTQEIEIIHVIPNSEIILRIEEITQLDVFYSPTHKAVLKRQRKKRKLDTMFVTTPENEPMYIVWKDSPIDPSENLINRSHFVGAYAIMTIDKATKVQMLLKEKEQKNFAAGTTISPRKIQSTSRITSSPTPKRIRTDENTTPSQLCRKGFINTCHDK